MHCVAPSKRSCDVSGVNRQWGGLLMHQLVMVRTLVGEDRVFICGNQRFVQERLGVGYRNLRLKFMRSGSLVIKERCRAR